MKLTHENIYTYSLQLQNAFKDDNQRLPVKINFYLQKNKKALMDIAMEIEEERMNILRTYGTFDDEGGVTIAPDKIAEASREMSDLLALERDVNIYTIPFENIPEDLSLTTAQMEALMFMIKAE
jgi:hypothetical protein